MHGVVRRANQEGAMQTKIDKEPSAIEPDQLRPSRDDGLKALRGTEIPPRGHKAAGPPEVTILNDQRPLMSARQLAERLGVSLSWVNKAHVYGTGVPATRVGRRRLYDPLDVEKWLATRKQQNTSEQI
jgi:hypothetical protein